MRLQNAFRVRKAKQKFDFMRVANLKMGETRRQDRKDAAILKLQCWARGLKWRAWFRKNLPRLTQEVQDRSWCVECMQQFATRRCTTCLDRYCESCWPIIHRAGRKRQHAWDLITPPQSEYQEFQDGTSLGFGLGAGGAGAVPAEWVEYFDENAGSKYWYNVNTGEASWVKPS